MTSVCATPFKLAAARLTALDACGVPLNTSTSTFVVTGSLIEIAETEQWEDQEEFFTKNGIGEFCTKDATPPIYKYSDLQITLCGVDPEFVNFASGQSLVMDDSASPQAIGYNTEENAAGLVNFAFEGWTLLTNKASCSTGFPYGYIVWPWNIQGQIADQTYGNSTVNLVIKSRTQENSPWGVGPYNVTRSNATLTEGLPIPLYTSILPLQHARKQLVNLTPPVGYCGGAPTEFALAAPTVAGMLVTVNFPSPTTTLPAMINWGDGTTPTTVTSGTNTTHTYAGSGTYTISYNLLSGSAAPYTATVTL